MPWDTIRRAEFRVQTGIDGKAICSCLNATVGRADVRLSLDCALVEIPESGQDPKNAMPELRPTTLITRAEGLPATVIDLETMLLPENQGQHHGLARTSHVVAGPRVSTCQIERLSAMILAPDASSAQAIEADPRRFVEPKNMQALGSSS